MKTPDIIILALSRWDGPYSSTAICWAKELAKTNRVFYIDNPFTIKDFIFEFWSDQIQRRWKALLFRKEIFRDLGKKDQSLIALTAPLALPINFLPEGKLYNWLSKINDRLFFKSINHMFKAYDIKDFIFINIFNPFYAINFPSFFRPRKYVYYTNDDIANSLYVQKHGVRLEKDAIQKATVTFATSYELMRIASSKSKHVHYLPNGVDQSIFFNNHNMEMPAELQKITTPIIVFTGNCDHRIDVDIVKQILTTHVDKTLVMIGPVMVSKDVVDELKEFPNLVFLGKKDLAELPHYLQYSQCAIIPYKCNALTKSIYPLKLNEYLASGTPVVATPFSEDIEKFDGVVLLGKTREDFCDKIATAILHDTREKRQARIEHAKRNNWTNRISEFWDVIKVYKDQHSLN